MKNNNPVRLENNANNKIECKRTRFHFAQPKNIFLALFDMVAVTLAFFFALWFRFDCQFTQIPDGYRDAWLQFAPLYAVACVVVFRIFHLYQSIWRFASYVELERIL